jgi:3-oxoacyl-[acyl-carrier-protein] synthase II
MRRVAITGMGAICAIAGNVSAYTEALLEGRRGFSEIDLFDTSDYRTHLAAQVALPDEADAFLQTFPTSVSRTDLFGLIAAGEALEKAGVMSMPESDLAATGVIMGGSTGAMFEAESWYLLRLQENAEKAVSDGVVSGSMATTADSIGNFFGLYGPRSTIMTACSSSANALAYGAFLIRSGVADVILAGGADALCRLTFSGFNALLSIDPEGCRPFDLRRKGLSLGEGAGVLVLESFDHALDRGGLVLAELSGFGICGEAHHITRPLSSGKGAEHSMSLALQDAGLSSGDIDYINAHGTGTPSNDLMETRGIKSALGEHAYQVPVSSSKSQIGHTLGSAGALEAIAVVLAIKYGFVPATMGLEVPDPECDLDYVPQASRKAVIRHALSNSFAFGGNNTTLVFSSLEG